MWADCCLQCLAQRPHRTTEVCVQLHTAAAGAAAACVAAWLSAGGAAGGGASYEQHVAWLRCPAAVGAAGQ